ncbi:MAG: hypothetical protein LBC96_06865 [Lachnospiraceae bacterium]|jgi:hypothetical protein|nr:hypothetical protein [Lachnospiraceae bacterium]
MLATATSREVSIDEVGNPISSSEYEELLIRLTQKGYLNDPELNDDGLPIEVDDFILSGLTMLNQIKLGVQVK